MKNNSNCDSVSLSGFMGPGQPPSPPTVKCPTDYSFSKASRDD